MSFSNLQMSQFQIKYLHSKFKIANEIFNLLVNYLV